MAIIHYKYNYWYLRAYKTACDFEDKKSFFSIYLTGKTCYEDY